MSDYWDDEFEKGYSGFEEGYTSGDNRRQAQSQREQRGDAYYGRQNGSDGSGGRYGGASRGGESYYSRYGASGNNADRYSRQDSMRQDASRENGDYYSRRSAGEYSDLREDNRRYEACGSRPAQRDGQRNASQRDYSARDYGRQSTASRQYSDAGSARGEEYYSRRTGRPGDDVVRSRAVRPQDGYSLRTSNTVRGQSVREPAERRSPGGIAGWFSGLSSGAVTALLIGAIVVVVGVLVLCVALQSSCSCSGRSSAEGIPVVEQGDGDEALPTAEQQPYVPESGSDVGETENYETETVELTVFGMDGMYSRTNVYRADEAVLNISGQDKVGFSFSLEVSSASGEGSVSGQAYACGTSEAVYEGAAGRLNFSFGTGGVTVYQTDSIPSLNGISPDGVYVYGTPTYIEDAAAQAEERGLDADIYKSEAVQSALSGLLTQNDMTLLEFLFANGNQLTAGTEHSVDKNGRDILVDSEMNAIKYYYFISGTGEELVLICTDDAKVYVGICDGAQYRYYTNDPDYAETAPRAISGQAKGKGMTLVYC